MSLTEAETHSHLGARRGDEVVITRHGQPEPNAPALPELARRIPDLLAPQVAEPEKERFLLFEAVTGLLAAASRDSPVVFLLDDLHWGRHAGAAPLEAPRPLGRADRLLVIGTYREGR